MSLVGTFSKSSLSGIYPSSCCSVTLISTGSGGCNNVGDNTSEEKKKKYGETVSFDVHMACTVNSHYCRHSQDRDLVSVLARVRITRVREKKFKDVLKRRG